MELKMKNSLVITNTDAKLTLKKVKRLMAITNKILEKKDDGWLDFLLDWLDKNIIQKRTNYPRKKDDLVQIKYISLRWNRLKQLPIEFFNLRKIETLELNNNVLESIPDEICNLKNLKNLNLNINNLNMLPHSIVKLKKLEMINIKNNKRLSLNKEQIRWLTELKQKGCQITYDKYKFNLGE